MIETIPREVLAIEPISMTARVTELSRRCAAKSQVTHTQFLNPGEQAEAVAVCEKRKLAYKLFGGNPKARRQLLFFLPDCADEVFFSPEEELCALRGEAKFASLTHRDVLGALMGLGVKRECLGDIYAEGEQVVFYVTAAMAPFVLLNLTSVGKSGISLEKIPLEEVVPPEQQVENVTFTVQTLRLDSVLAGAFSLSRSVAAELIARGVVAKNDRLCTKVDSPVVSGDVLSARGHGKAEIKAEGGHSKKGRCFITAARYL